MHENSKNIITVYLNSRYREKPFIERKNLAPTTPQITFYNPEHRFYSSFDLIVWYDPYGSLRYAKRWINLKRWRVIVGYLA